MGEPAVDPLQVLKTLKFLGKELRLHQFILKGVKRRRKQAEKDEQEVRNKLNHIKLRVQRELDAHPDIIRKFTNFDPES